MQGVIFSVQALVARFTRDECLEAGFTDSWPVSLQSTLKS